MADISPPLHIIYVEAWIQNGNTFLISKRSATAERSPGKWTIPGGKVYKGYASDPLRQSLKAKVSEKVGIKTAGMQYIGSREFSRIDGQNVIGVSFLTKYLAGEAHKIDGFDEIRWVTYDELRDYLNDKSWESVLIALGKTLSNV